MKPMTTFFFVFSAFLFYLANAAPSLRVMPDQLPPQLLTLPSNATSIRADIDDSFSCEGREYGYYADVENDCQLFHVCLPVTYPGNTRQQTFRWSFICPDETVFNQEIFTCTRADEAIDCAESPRFYELNRSFGEPMETTDQHLQQVEDATTNPEVSQLMGEAVEQRHPMPGIRRTSKY